MRRPGGDLVGWAWLLAAALSAGIAPVAGQAPPASSKPAAGSWVERTLAGLSLERKVAQLVSTDVAGGYLADDDPRLARWLELVREHGLGMLVFYGGTPRDVAHLLNRLQRAAAIPILVAADFEGGPGQQVTGASEFPGDMALSAVGSDELVYRVASAAAAEGRAMGIHLTYTPVVDLTLRPDNPAENVRTFGGDLDLLGRMVRAYVRGYHDHGMLTTAKHFPGRGDVEAMPENPPWTWNPKASAAVVSQEFAAFRHAIEAGVDFVMTEHIAVPSVTGGSTLPASVEPKLARDWLRDSLGFKGLLTSDDLWYDHVVQRFGREEVAIKAFEAGHDIILKPKDPVATIAALAAAVRSGRISERRIDDAVRKLLTLKARLGLDKTRLVDEDAVGRSVGTAAHQALVQEVADRSITLLKNDGVLPVDPAKLRRVVNLSVQKLDTDPAPAALALKLAQAFPGIQSFALRGDQDPGAAIWPAIEQADLVILSLFVQRNRLGDATPIRPADLAILIKVIETKPNAVVAMSYGNPQLIRKLPSVPAFLVGYGEKGWFGNQAVYFDSFIKVLSGSLVPSAKLPVRVNDTYPLGSGLVH